LTSSPSQTKSKLTKKTQRFPVRSDLFQKDGKYLAPKRGLMHNGSFDSGQKNGSLRERSRSKEQKVDLMKMIETPTKSFIKKKPKPKKKSKPRLKS
jgi:hypothetical protein